MLTLTASPSHDTLPVSDNELLPDEQLPLWAADLQEILNRPDDPDRKKRPTEWQALNHVDRYHRAIAYAGRRLELSPIYWRILKLERAALRYHPGLDYDERMEFILVNLEDDRAKRFSRRKNQAQAWMPLEFSSREIEGYLEKIEDVLLTRDRLRLETVIEDFSETQARACYRKYLNAPRVRQGGRAA